MAQYRAEIKGQRSSASRLGSKKSGIESLINGWNIGVKVEITCDDLGRDHVYISMTSGSNAGKNPELIAEFCEDKLIYISDQVVLNDWLNPNKKAV